LFQRCVHLGCRVPWCATSVGFECPCHGSKYNVIGEYFDGPAPRNLDRFAVEVQGDRFIIKTGTILETPRAQALSVNYPQGPSCIGAVADAGEHCEWSSSPSLRLSPASPGSASSSSPRC